jgi:uncharacterized protein YndB with AHSA1/START domain
MDASFPLHFQREVPITPAQAWRGWADPATLMQWFCPRPWSVVECDIDLKPGGIFRTLMQSPTGQRMPDMAGCYLVVEPHHRLVWTNALGPGFVPNALSAAGAGLSFFVTAELRFDALPNLGTGGTHYQATVWHADEAARTAHASMGFEQGWGIALDQLVALMRG